MDKRVGSWTDDALSGPSWATSEMLDAFDREEEEFESHLRQLRASALADISAALVSSGPSIQPSVAAVASRMAKRIGGGCLIRPLPGTRGGLPVAADHVRRRSRALLVALVRESPDALGSAYCEWVAQRGRPILTQNVSPKPWRRWTDQAAWPYVEQCEITTFLVAPVQAAGRVVGTLAVWRERPGQPLDQDDQVFAVEVGRRLVSLPIG